MPNSEEYGSIQKLESSRDMLDKAKYDFKRHCEDNDIYSFMDCLLSLNAIPDWIKKDDRIPDEKKDYIDDLINFMKHGETDDLSLIENKLRLVRLICNHTKHGGKKGEAKHLIPNVRTISGFSFPITFPIRFGTFVALGNDEREVRPIISDIIEYFESKLSNSDFS